MSKTRTTMNVHDAKNVNLGEIRTLSMSNGETFAVRHIEIGTEGGMVVVTIMAEEESDLEVKL